MNASPAGTPWWHAGFQTGVLVLVAVFAAALAVGAFYLGSDDTDLAATRPTTTTTTTPTTSSTTTTVTTTEPPTTTTTEPEPEPEPEPEAEPVDIVTVRGLPSVEAEQALEDSGVEVAVVYRESSEFPPGTALRTNPSAGTSVSAGSTVKLVVALSPSCNDIMRPLPVVTFNDYSSSFLAPGAEVLDAIAWAQDIELVKGNGDGNFGRQDELTREVAALLIHRYFCSPEPSGPPQQADVESTGPFADAIAWVTERGIMGSPDRDFEPENPTVRQIWYWALWRAFGSPVSEVELPYTDVDEGAWYDGAIRWATEEGVVPVVGTEFDRTGWVFKQQAVVDLFRIEQIVVDDAE